MNSSKIFYTRTYKELIPRKRKPLNNIYSFLRNTYISTVFSINKISNNDNFLRLIYCHHVFDDQEQCFREVIELLLGNGNFITTDHCIRILKGESQLDGNYYHLSFDDGFKNIYDNAFPILSEYKIPSLFFVPTAFIGAQTTVAKEYCINSLGMLSTLEIVEWSDLEEMVDYGIDIGSHTRHHVNLFKISGQTNRLHDEICGSKYDIEKHLGIPCKYISWPYGEAKHIDVDSVNFIKESGYNACFSAIRGDVNPMSTDIFYIPRNHFEVEWPANHLKYFLL